MTKVELIQICDKHNKQIGIMFDALTKIAAFNDFGANDRLEANGSYSGFDEPGSVQIAREAIASVQAI